MFEFIFLSYWDGEAHQWGGLPAEREKGSYTY